MINPEIELEIEIEKVRVIFESHRKDISNTFFGSFPRGSCGNVCCFLAQWLTFKGYKGFKYIYGERDGYSHAWLLFGDIYIDITSDQFDDGLGRVYIGPNNEFYNSFDEQQEGCLDIPAELFDSYNKFKDLMGNLHLMTVAIGDTLYLDLGMIIVGNVVDNHSDEEIECLAKDILNNGMDHPVLVCITPSGGFELVAGVARYRAASMLKQTKIECRIVEKMDYLQSLKLINNRRQN